MRLYKIILKKIKETNLGSVIKSFFSLSIIQSINYILPLITTPYIARVIGLEKYGMLAFALSLSQYFVVFTSYGFNLTATRNISRNRSDVNELSIIFSRVMYAKLLLMLISSTIYVTIVLIVPTFRSNMLLYLFSFLVVVDNVIYPQWFFQGVEKMKFLTYFKLITASLYVISIFIFIKEETDFIYIPLLRGLSLIVTGIVSLVIIYKTFNIKFKFTSLLDIKNELISGRYVFLNQLLPQLYNNSSTFLLGIFAPASSVGLYSAAQKVVDIGLPFLRMLSTSFFPHLSNSLDNFKIWRKIVIIISSFITIMYLIFSKLIFIILYTPEFYEGVYITYILAIGVIFLGLYSCYGTNYLIIIGKDKELMNNTMIVSFIGLGTAFLFVYFLHAYGAAINVTLVRSFMALGAYYIYTKNKIEKVDQLSNFKL